MILRKLASAVRREHWFTAVLEVLVVIVGLFAGLQLDDWNEARKDRIRGKIYHQRLVDDLKSELEMLKMRIGYYEAVRVHAENVIRDLRGPREGLGEAFVIEAYQASQIWEYHQVSDTYDELVSAGEVNLIPDAELRSRLAQYYQETIALMRYWNVDVGYRDLVRAHIPVDVQRRIQSECKDWEGAEAYQLGTSQVSACAPGLDQEAVARSLAMMLDMSSLGAEKLLITANHQAADLDSKIARFKQKQESAAALIELMEARE